jgi:FMN phosphatase YigB (HAD superfamily)
MAGVGTHEALFIDDLSENIIAAKKFGINSFLFTTFEQLKIDLKRLNLSRL